MRKTLKLILPMLGCLMMAGCTIPRDIRPIEPPANHVHLNNLENNLDYQDPDANQPDYNRN